MKISVSPSQKFSPCPSEAEFLKLQLYQTKGFVPCPGRENILKPNASLLLFYRTSQVPALGAAQAAPPNPCRPFLFLLEEKEAKDYLGGTPLTGAVPLCHFVTFPPHSGGIFPKDPQGGALWPRPPYTPTAGKL